MGEGQVRHPGFLVLHPIWSQNLISYEKRPILPEILPDFSYDRVFFYVIGEKIDIFSRAFL